MIRFRHGHSQHVAAGLIEREQERAGRARLQLGGGLLLFRRRAPAEERVARQAPARLHQRPSAQGGLIIRPHGLDQGPAPAFTVRSTLEASSGAGSPGRRLGEVHGQCQRLAVVVRSSPGPSLAPPLLMSVMVSFQYPPEVTWGSEPMVERPAADAADCSTVNGNPAMAMEPERAAPLFAAT